MFHEKINMFLVLSWKDQYFLVFHEKVSILVWHETVKMFWFSMNTKETCLK